VAPLALAAALATPARTIHAADYTWKGGGNIWSNAGNWNPGGGPPGNNPKDTAAINKGPGVVLDKSQTIAGLTMNSAAAGLFIPKNQTLTVNGPAMLTQGRISLDGGTLAGTGTLTITAKSSVTSVSMGSTINNPIVQQGTLAVQANNGAADLSLGMDLTNDGKINLSNAAGKDFARTLTINQGKGTLTNNGSVTLDAGKTEVDINATLVNKVKGVFDVLGTSPTNKVGFAGAKSSNLGEIRIGPGATLTLIGASFINDKQAGDSGLIVGGRGTLDRTGIPKGGWTNNGDVRVANVIAPPAQGPQAAPAYQPGLLNWVGDFVQSPSAELDIPINHGGVAGTDYSQLMITQGAAILDGQLDVSVGDPADISAGDIFTILTSDSGLSGFFANAIPDSQGMANLAADGGTFTLEYIGSATGPSSVELTGFVAAVPEPSGLLLLASGAIVLFSAFCVRRRRARVIRPARHLAGMALGATLALAPVGAVSARAGSVILTLETVERWAREDEAAKLAAAPTPGVGAVERAVASFDRAV
jgi:hypothetical protein